MLSAENQWERGGAETKNLIRMGGVETETEILNL